MKPSEQEVYEMTTQLLDIYCQRRVRIFFPDCGTKSALWTNKLRRLHGSPSELIGAYRTPSARHLRVNNLKKEKKKEKFTVGDHYAFRTPQGKYLTLIFLIGFNLFITILFSECRNELVRVGKVIDEMLKPIVKAAEHNIGHGLKSTPDPNLCKNKKNISSTVSFLLNITAFDAI